VSTLEIKNELAYDLLQDHFETVLELLDAPMPCAELVRRVGSTATERLVRHGLLAIEGDSVRAVSNVYQQVRQEGMMTFLSRYVVPALTASLGEGSDSTAGLSSYFLRLSREEMAGLRVGVVGELLGELGEVSDSPASGPTGRLTVLVVGTSHLVSGDASQGDLALLHLKHAAQQRSNPAEKTLAVLTQGDLLADAGRYDRARAHLLAFEAKLASFRVEPERATYHLTVAHHWRAPSARGVQHAVRQ
jgi:hypothetical protein